MTTALHLVFRLAHPIQGADLVVAGARGGSLSRMEVYRARIRREDGSLEVVVDTLTIRYRLAELIGRPLRVREGARPRNRARALHAPVRVSSLAGALLLGQTGRVPRCRSHHPRASVQIGSPSLRSMGVASPCSTGLAITPWSSSPTTSRPGQG